MFRVVVTRVPLPNHPAIQQYNFETLGQATEAANRLMNDRRAMKVEILVCIGAWQRTGTNTFSTH